MILQLAAHQRTNCMVSLYLKLGVAVKVVYDKDDRLVERVLFSQLMFMNPSDGVLHKLTHEEIKRIPWRFTMNTKTGEHPTKTGEHLSIVFAHPFTLSERVTEINEIHLLPRKTSPVKLLQAAIRRKLVVNNAAMVLQRSVRRLVFKLKFNKRLPNRRGFRLNWLE
jgi:hypothetical protein